jgi:hypothetical protein
MREMEGHLEDSQCQETVPSMVPMVPEGRPTENKKENAVVAPAVHLERVQPMVENVSLRSCQARPQGRRQMMQGAMMMVKQDIKIEIKME